ncbi:MAG: FtsX-like permease family protein, partial [Moraxellaceae bacterium]
QAEDDIPGAPKVAVLSYKLWQEVFSGDANAIGKMAKVQGENYTIVGVMPEGFMFPVQHELRLPLQLEYASAPPEGLNSSNVFMFGRMRANESIESADMSMRNLIRQIASEFPNTYHPKGEIKSWPMSRLFFQGDYRLIFLMSGAAIAILLLVVFNVGNMLLARANESVREIAIKSALGVPRLALMQQTLSESFILCLVGAVFGVIFAYAGLQVIEANMQTITSFPPPFWWEFDIHLKGLLVIAGVTFVTWLATGIIPAWRASGVDCINVLKDGNKGGASKVNNKLAHVLVCLQIAISSILISMALGNAIKLSRMLLVGGIPSSSSSDSGVRLGVRSNGEVRR